MSEWRCGGHSIFLFIAVQMCLPEFALAQSQAVPPVLRPVLVEGKKASRMVLDQVKPEYPALALVNYIQGHVKVELQVARDGKVAHAHVVEGNPILAASALKAVPRWLYRPLVTPSGPSVFLTVVDLNLPLRRQISDSLPAQAERDLRRQIIPPEVIGRTT
jgi:TonB family protein